MTLSADEQATLERWARRAKSSQVLAMRSKIVLACAGGLDNIEITAALKVHRDTVSMAAAVRPAQVEGLMDEQRPGAPPSVTLDQVEQVVLTTLEQTPRFARIWTRSRC